MTGEPGAAGPSADVRAEGQGVLGLGERERDYLLAYHAEQLIGPGAHHHPEALHVAGGE